MSWIPGFDDDESVDEQTVEQAKDTIDDVVGDEAAENIADEVTGEESDESSQTDSSPSEETESSSSTPDQSTTDSTTQSSSTSDDSTSTDTDSTSDTTQSDRSQTGNETSDGTDESTTTESRNGGSEQTSSASDRQSARDRARDLVGSVVPDSVMDSAPEADDVADDPIGAVTDAGEEVLSGDDSDQGPDAETESQDTGDEPDAPEPTTGDQFGVIPDESQPEDSDSMETDKSGKQNESDQPAPDSESGGPDFEDVAQPDYEVPDGMPEGLGSPDMPEGQAPDPENAEFTGTQSQVDSDEIQGLDVDVNPSGDDPQEISKSLQEQLSQQVPGKEFTDEDVAITVDERDGQRVVEVGLNFKGKQKLEEGQQEALKRSAAEEYSEAAEYRDFEAGDFEVDDSAIKLDEDVQEEVLEAETAAFIDEQYPEVDIGSEDLSARVTDDGRLETSIGFETRQEIAATEVDEETETTVDEDDILLQPGGEFGLDEETRRQEAKQQAAEDFSEETGRDITPAMVEVTETDDGFEAEIDPPELEETSDRSGERYEPPELTEEQREALQGSAPGDDPALQGQQTVAPTGSQYQQIQNTPAQNIKRNATGFGQVFSEQVTAPTADIAGDIADIGVQGVNVNAALLAGNPDQAVGEYTTAVADLTRGPENEVGEPTAVESGTEKLTTGAVNLGRTGIELPATAVTASEVATGSVDFTAEAIEDEGVLEGTQTSLEAAGETTASYGQQQAQYIVNNPYKTTGALAGSALLMGGAARLSPQAGLASRAAIQPGEELLGYGGRAVTQRVSPTAARKLFPNNEPLIFSEEAAIRGAKAGGRAVRSGLSRGADVFSRFDTPSVSIPNVEVGVEIAPGKGPIDINTPGSLRRRLDRAGVRLQRTKDLLEQRVSEVPARTQQEVRLASEDVANTGNDVFGDVNRAIDRGRRGGLLKAQRARNRVGEVPARTGQEARLASAEATEKINERLKQVGEQVEFAGQRAELAGLRAYDRASELPARLDQEARLTADDIGRGFQRGADAVENAVSEIPVQTRRVAVASSDQLRNVFAETQQLQRRVQRSFDEMPAQVGQEAQLVFGELQDVNSNLFERTFEGIAGRRQGLREARQQVELSTTRAVNRASELPARVRQEARFASTEAADRVRDRVEEVGEGIEVAEQRGDEIFEAAFENLGEAKVGIKRLPAQARLEAILTRQRLGDLRTQVALSRQQLPDATLRIDVGKPSQVETSSEVSDLDTDGVVGEVESEGGEIGGEEVTLVAESETEQDVGDGQVSIERSGTETATIARTDVDTERTGTGTDIVRAELPDETDVAPEPIDFEPEPIEGVENIPGSEDVMIDGFGTDSVVDVETGVDQEVGTEPDMEIIEPETGMEIEPETGMELDTEVEPETGSEVENEFETETEQEVALETELEMATEAELESETETETEPFRLDQDETAEDEFFVDGGLQGVRDVEVTLAEDPDPVGDTGAASAGGDISGDDKYPSIEESGAEPLEDIESGGFEAEMENPFEDVEDPFEGGDPLDE